MRSYTITKDADVLAPKWLAVRINDLTVKFVYCLKDGAVRLKGVRIGDQVAEIGDVVCLNGKRLSVVK